MVFLQWDFTRTLQKYDQMSLTKNLKKDITCIICRIETKNWVKGDQVVVVLIEKNNMLHQHIL